MLIGLCTITLHLHGVHSLKEKRSIIKGLLQRMHNQLNAGVAEIDAQDQWNRAIIALSTVSLSEAVIYSIFRRAEAMAEQAPGAEIVDVSISLL